MVENNQLPDGRVEIPEVLSPFLEIFERAPHDYLEPTREE
jgi:seryl-tRNA synthetase